MRAEAIIPSLACFRNIFSRSQMPTTVDMVITVTLVVRRSAYSAVAWMAALHSLYYEVVFVVRVPSD